MQHRVVDGLLGLIEPYRWRERCERREANGIRRSARRAASVIRHLRFAAAAEIWLRWTAGGGSRRGRRAGQQLVQLSEGQLRGGARYLEAEIKEALVNGGSDRDAADGGRWTDGQYTK